MKIGISGLGFVGNAIITSLTTHGFVLNENLFAYDKYKNFGSFENLIKCDIIFLALPTPYDENLQQFDKSALIENLQLLNNYDGYILIKSTVEPTTCVSLDPAKRLKIIHNPEFLTARTAFNDFHNQSHIVLGKTFDFNIDMVVSFYNKYYNAKISICNSTESELLKLFLNSFYAIKVQTFTEFYILCQKLNIKYDEIRNMMINNGWINKMHTNIPGPDGNISYGGLCFPKDTQALRSFMIKQTSPNMVLSATINERGNMRENKIDLKTSCVLKGIYNKMDSEFSNATVCEVKPVTPKVSVIDFDQKSFSEAMKDKKAMDMNNVELLKMLLVKCADPGNPNPVMKNGVETLLRQLHSELPLKTHRKNVQNVQNVQNMQNMQNKQTRKHFGGSSNETAEEETKPDFPIGHKPPVKFNNKSTGRSFPPGRPERSERQEGSERSERPERPERSERPKQFGERKPFGKN